MSSSALPMSSACGQATTAQRGQSSVLVSGSRFLKSVPSASTHIALPYGLGQEARTGVEATQHEARHDARWHQRWLQPAAAYLVTPVAASLVTFVFVTPPRLHVRLQPRVQLLETGLFVKIGAVWPSHHSAAQPEQRARGSWGERRQNREARVCVRTMSHSRDVSAIIAMIAAELLLATVNVTVKWAGSWPNPNPT